LKDLLQPAGRILRADIALGPDGRSKGWGTAVFATPQEAQNAIDTFDGWEMDGRIIKVRWDKYQGSPSQPVIQNPLDNALENDGWVKATERLFSFLVMMTNCIDNYVRKLTYILFKNLPRFQM